MNIKFKYIAIFLGTIVIIDTLFFVFRSEKEPEPVACTQEAKLCPDGSAVGRTGPNCEFAECPAPKSETQYKDLIKINSLKSGDVITSPLKISGEARGYWFFEASFPVIIVDWDGRIIAQLPAEAKSDWMTEGYVPFEATISFTSPYKSGDPDFMKRGALILKKDNPSGDPIRDDAFEIPIKFAN